MPRAANGNYTLPVGNPVVTNTPISSTVQNTTMSDVAAALSDSLSRSGLGGMLAPLPFIAGTVNSPGFTWSTELVSGFYLAGTNDMRATVAGVQRMRWTSVGCDIWDVTANAGAGGWLAFSSAAGNNVALLNVVNQFTASQHVKGGSGWHAFDVAGTKSVLMAHDGSNGYLSTPAGSGGIAFYTEGTIRALLDSTGLMLHSGKVFKFNNASDTASKSISCGVANELAINGRGGLLHWQSNGLTAGQIVIQTTTPAATGQIGTLVFVYE